MEVRNEQPQRRLHRLRMPEEVARDPGSGGARSNADEQAEVGQQAGGSALVEETAHQAKWHSIGIVGECAFVDSHALQHGRLLHPEFPQQGWDGPQRGNRQVG
jgi:hypothetical protein